MFDAFGRRHSEFGGSNCHRWLPCAAAVPFSRRAPPREPTIDMLRGTYAHTLFEAAMRTGHLPGPEVEQDIRIAVTIAVEIVWQWFRELPDPQPHSIEQWRPFPQDIVPPEDCGGSDDYTMRYAGTAFRITDYKNGVVYVDHIGNKQLLFYGTCILWREPAISHIDLCIIQPNAFHAEVERIWRINAWDLVDFRADVLLALEAAQQPDPQPVAGEHCKYCPAQTFCPAYEKLAMQVLHEQFAGIGDFDDAWLPAPNAVPMPHVLKVLENAEIVRDWLTGVESYAYSMAKQGFDVPGHKLVAATARRTWHHSVEETAAHIAKMSQGKLGIDDVAPRQMLGIVELEKKLVSMAHDAAPKGQKRKAGEDMKHAFAWLTTKQSSGNLSLVPATDGRPAVSPAEVAFGGVQLPPPPT